jgi:4'-phosphopantetheinyl transferase
VPERRYDLWWATVAQLRPGHQDLLSQTERERRDRYVRAADQDRFSLGAVLVRLAVECVTGRPARTLEVNRACDRCGQQHGKPRFDDLPLEVSVSHSGDVAVVVVGGPDPVGVDVELVRPVDAGQLAPLVLAPGERLRDSSDESFLRHWTRKEAVLKATGDGLRTPLREVVLTDFTERLALLSYGGRPGLRAHVQDLDSPDGYVAAVAVLGGEAPFAAYDGLHLLANARRSRTR